MTNIEDIKKLRDKLNAIESYLIDMAIKFNTDVAVKVNSDVATKEAQEAVYWDSVSMFGDLQEY